MNRTNIICLLSGLVTGGAAGYFITRRFLESKYSDMAEQQIAEMEDYYSSQDRYRRISHDETDVNPSEDRNQGKNHEYMTLDEKQAAKRAIREQAGGTHATEYNKMYQPSSDPVIDEDPENLDERDPEPVETPVGTDEELEEQAYQEGLAAFEEHQANQNKPPKIISSEAAGELPNHYEFVELNYYTDNDTLVKTENDEVIEDPDLFIGDALTKFAFRDNDEEQIFVVNYSWSTCFEITKIWGEWEG